MERAALDGLLADLVPLFCRPLRVKHSGRGRHGFRELWVLEAKLDDGAPVEVGSVCYGGESQRGRWLLEVTGKGCGLIKDWAGMRDLLEFLDASITRADLAVDFLYGERSVDDVMARYQGGAFISRGRNPKLSTEGEWHEGGEDGRTVYVGVLRNGKCLCAYEKGRQLNMKDSNWTRYEVRLSNKDRTIPLDVLTYPDKYFAGAYPALADVLEVGAEEIPTHREEAKASLAHALYHTKRSFGKYLHQTLQATGCSVEDLIEEIRVYATPKRLDPAAVMAGVDWQVVQEQIRSIENEHKH